MSQYAAIQCSKIFNDRSNSSEITTEELAKKYSSRLADRDQSWLGMVVPENADAFLKVETHLRQIQQQVPEKWIPNIREILTDLEILKSNSYPIFDSLKIAIKYTTLVSALENPRMNYDKEVHRGLNIIKMDLFSDYYASDKASHARAKGIFLPLVRFTFGLVPEDQMILGLANGIYYVGISTHNNNRFDGRTANAASFTIHDISHMKEALIESDLQVIGKLFETPEQVRDFLIKRGAIAASLLTKIHLLNDEVLKRRIIQTLFHHMHESHLEDSLGIDRMGSLDKENLLLRLSDDKSAEANWILENVDEINPKRDPLAI